jgi:hypothetical protein
MFKFRTLSFGIAVALILTMFSGVGVLAQDSPKVVNPGIEDLRGLSLSQIEALHPMSAEALAAITYDFVTYPVVVDGILYQPNEMTRFNGTRLHFIYGKDDCLIAFQAVDDLEKYLYNEYGVLWGGSPNRITDDLDPYYNYYYADWYYGGNCVAIHNGEGCTDLNTLNPNMNDCIDSAHTRYWSTLYDDANYTVSQ